MGVREKPQCRLRAVRDETMDAGLSLCLSPQVQRDIDHEGFVLLCFVHPPMVGFQQLPTLGSQLFTRECRELLKVLADERLDGFAGNAAGRYGLSVLPRPHNLLFRNKQIAGSHGIPRCGMPWVRGGGVKGKTHGTTTVPWLRARRDPLFVQRRIWLK